MTITTKAKNPVRQKPRVSPIRRAVWAYLSATALTLVIVGFTTRFYKIDLSIPMWYQSDTGFYLMLVKGLISHEWSPFSVPHTPRLGAPLGFSLYDFPGVADSNLILLMMKVISFLTPDIGRVYNYYGIVTFFLPVFTAIYALRHYRISYKVAIVFALLFSFLPYHFRHLLVHPNLALYALVPFWILILTWIGCRKPIFCKRQNGKYIWDFKSYKARFSIGVLVISGLTAFYYNFFFCLFALTAGISAYLYRKSRQHLMASFILMAIVVAALVPNLIPYVKYKINNGPNTAVAVRSHSEAELYGLKMVELLLPVYGHRIGLLGRITDKYYNGATDLETDETSWGNLCIFGSMGFLFLLFYFLAPMRNHKSIYYKLGLLVLAAVLFATIGGFSSLFALLTVPLFRGYTRISIFIAYLSLLPVALAVNKYQKYLPPWLSTAGLAAILLVGILDQTTPSFKYTFSHHAIKNEFLSDQAFIRNIENAAPPNALIFQLPFMEFPEGPTINRVGDYEHFKGYLHSSNLSWSYGAMKGRYPGLWYEHMAKLPIDQMLYKLGGAGFSGVYIDRNGYPDRAAALETKLAELLQEPPRVSNNQRLSYFDITHYSDQILKTLDKAALENLKQAARFPSLVSWDRGCAFLETSEAESWRWCGNDAQLTIMNYSNAHRKQSIAMELTPSRPEPYEVVIQGEDFLDVVQLENSRKKYERIIDMPMKRNVTIKFHSSVKPVSFPDDPRKLVFAIHNFALRDGNGSN